MKLILLMLAGLLLAACAAQAAPLPPELEAGRAVYESVCSTCHGDRGQGLSGPSLSGVIETFPACDDQVEWIALGSEKWKAEVDPNYGAQDKPITEIMPGFESSLSAQQIRQVAAYQRAVFGGEDQAMAIDDCGA